MRQLDHEKMLHDIDNLLQSDEAASFIDHGYWLDGKDFTQGEAREMSRLLGLVYSISHGVTCRCGDKYEIKI